MNRRRNPGKPGQSISIATLTKWGLGAIFVTALGFGFQVGLFSSHGTSPSLWQRYRLAFKSTQRKVAEIQHAMQDNQRLRYENSNLRLKLETLQFEYHEQQAREETQAIGSKMAKQGGSPAARTLASIPYKAPENLLPGQLYTLAVTYFKAGENEKAAVILSFLTGMEDNTAFQTARNYLMTGVAWYRLDNFDLADLYFDKVLKEPHIDENMRFQAQARLWKGLVAQHFGKTAEAQYWLRKLVDRSPHSLEASWVNGNPTETERVPASAKH